MPVVYNRNSWEVVDLRRRLHLYSSSLLPSLSHGFSMQQTSVLSIHLNWSNFNSTLWLKKKKSKTQVFRMPQTNEPTQSSIPPQLMQSKTKLWSKCYKLKSAYLLPQKAHTSSAGCRQTLCSLQSAKWAVLSMASRPW